MRKFLKGRALIASLTAATMAVTMTVPLAAATSQTDTASVGHAYIALGGNTVCDSSVSENGVSVTICTDPSGTFGDYVDASVNVEYDDLMDLVEEGMIPVGVYIEGDKKFDLGYTTTETDDNGLPVYCDIDSVPVNEDGTYSITITDIDLTEANFDLMIYDDDWGWGGESTANNKVTIYLMCNEIGSWNTYYYSLTDADGNVNYSSDVTQTEVEFASGEEFVLEADLATGFEHAYFVAPTLVFDDDLPALGANQTYADLGYEVSVQLFVDDEEIEIDASAGDMMWAEDTGNNLKAYTARVYGGANEWGTNYVDQSVFEGATKIKYVITVTVPDNDVTTHSGEDTEDVAGGDFTANVLVAVLGCAAIAFIAMAAVKKRKIEEM